MCGWRSEPVGRDIIRNNGLTTSSRDHTQKNNDFQILQLPALRQGITESEPRPSSAAGDPRHPRARVGRRNLARKKLEPKVSCFTQEFASGQTRAKCGARATGRGGLWDPRFQVAASRGRVPTWVAPGEQVDVPKDRCTPRRAVGARGSAQWN